MLQTHRDKEDLEKIKLLREKIHAHRAQLPARFEPGLKKVLKRARDEIVRYLYLYSCFVYAEVCTQY